MLYLLDTNACVAYLRRVDSPVRQRLARHAAADIVVCSVVYAELYYGALLERIGEDGKLSLEETRRIAEVWQGFTYFRNDDVVLAKITPFLNRFVLGR